MENWPKGEKGLHSRTQLTYARVITEKVGVHVLTIPIMCTFTHFLCIFLPQSTSKPQCPCFWHFVLPTHNTVSWGTWLGLVWSGLQRLQWTQIIWVCPDIWVFSVLDNRHLADICAFCQKCQFEVRKAWNALFLQLKPHEMHCKQADSAILKIRCGWNYANCEYVLFAYGLLSYSDFKQTRAFVAKRDMSQILAFSDFFIGPR